MSIFSANISHRSFWWQINMLCFVLGLMLAAAAFTTTQINRAGVSLSNPALSYGSGMQVAAEKVASSESEIKKLRALNTELENKLAKGSDAARTINHELQDTKLIAGLTDVSGPGVQLTLNDAPKPTGLQTDNFNLGDIVHDIDLRNVIDELKASGAEAIAVNGQRIASSTAVRCVGPVIHINMVPCAPPYVVQAIGDPDTLFNGMNLPHGVLDEMRRSNPAMVRIEKKPKLQLSAWAGSTQFRFANPVKFAAKDSGSKESDK